MDEDFGPPEGLQYHERLNTDTNIAILQALHLRKGFNARDRRGRADIVYKLLRQHGVDVQALGIRKGRPPKRRVGKAQSGLTAFQILKMIRQGVELPVLPHPRPIKKRAGSVGMRAARGPPALPMLGMPPYEHPSTPTYRGPYVQLAPLQLEVVAKKEEEAEAVEELEWQAIETLRTRLQKCPSPPAPPQSPRSYGPTAFFPDREMHMPPDWHLPHAHAPIPTQGYYSYMPNTEALRT